MAADSDKYEVLQARPDRLVVVLPNRMIVIVQEVHTAPVVSAQVRVKTGAIYEQENIGKGLSHFLEHLLSGGSTTTRPEAESSKILGQIGASTNASTGPQGVSYYVDTSSNHVNEAVDLLSDWLMNNTIGKTEFKREQEVIRSEFALGRSDPNRIFWKLTQRLQYQIHPARHPVIGYLDEFNSITRKQIYSFYKRMYVPNNMVFVVVGDIDKQKVVDRIALHWNKAKEGKLPTIELPIEPTITAPRKAAGHADVQLPKLRLCWPATSLGGEGDFALDLLASVLGQGESSRLVQSLRNEKRMVNTISAGNHSSSWGGKGTFLINAEVVLAGGIKPEDIPKRIDATRDAILEQVKLIISEPVTAEELARAKRKVLAGVVLSDQTTNNLASRLASDTITMADPDYLIKWAHKIQSVTDKEVQAAAKRFLDSNKLMDLRLLPGEPTQFNRDDPKINGTKTKIFDLDNAVLIKRLKMNLDKTDQSIEITIDPIKRFTLPNGLRLLVQRNTLRPGVAIEFFQLGGLLADETGKEGVANAVTAMQMRGTKTRSVPQIYGTLESLGAGLGMRSGYNSSYASAQCLRDDWPVVMDMLADVVINPVFPQDEWERLRPRLVDGIHRNRESWWGELNMNFRRQFFKDHPWSQISSGRAEVVEKLTRDDLIKFHKQHLGAKDSVLAVIGDVDPQKVFETASKLFADLPTSAAVAFKPSKPKAPTTKVIQIKTKKSMLAANIGVGPGVTRDHPDYPALQVLARVLSAFPSGWLTEELRGKGRGLAYATFAYQVSGVSPGYFAVAFNSERPSGEEALARAVRVLHRARNELVAPDELERAKSKVLVDEFLGKQSNAQRATEAALNELYKLPKDEEKRFIQAVRSLTPKDLNAIAKKYLRNTVIVVLTNELIEEDRLKVLTDPEQPLPKFEYKKPAGANKK